MMTDPVADFLTRVRNAQRAGHRVVGVRASRLVEKILEVLKAEGFIGEFKREPDENPTFERIVVSLKYFANGRPVISSCQRVSRSGRRVYLGSEGIGRVRGGLGISVLSTSQGVMSDREAQKRGIGGEVLAAIC